MISCDLLRNGIVSSRGGPGLTDATALVYA